MGEQPQPNLESVTLVPNNYHLYRVRYSILHVDQWYKSPDKEYVITRYASWVGHDLRSGFTLTMDAIKGDMLEHFYLYMTSNPIEVMDYYVKAGTSAADLPDDLVVWETMKMKSKTITYCRPSKIFASLKSIL